MTNQKLRERVATLLDKLAQVMQEIEILKNKADCDFSKNLHLLSKWSRHKDFCSCIASYVFVYFRFKYREFFVRKPPYSHTEISSRWSFVGFKITIIKWSNIYSLWRHFRRFRLESYPMRKKTILPYSHTGMVEGYTNVLICMVWVQYIVKRLVSIPSIWSHDPPFLICFYDLPRLCFNVEFWLSKYLLKNYSFFIIAFCNRSGCHRI